MYITLQNGGVVALEPETGKELWRFETPVRGRSVRAVSYWPGDNEAGARLLYGAGDKLWALDPATGKPIESFGTKGVADVHPGQPARRRCRRRRQRRRRGGTRRRAVAAAPRVARRRQGGRAVRRPRRWRRIRRQRLLDFVAAGDLQEPRDPRRLGGRERVRRSVRRSAGVRREDRQARVALPRRCRSPATGTSARGATAGRIAAVRRSGA